MDVGEAQVCELDISLVRIFHDKGDSDFSELNIKRALYFLDILFFFTLY